MDGAVPGQITAFVAIMLKPGAVHEGRATWRPCAMFGHHVACFWDHTETNRKKAIEFAKPKVEALREGGYDVFKGGAGEA